MILVEIKMVIFFAFFGFAVLKYCMACVTHIVDLENEVVLLKCSLSNERASNVMWKVNNSLLFIERDYVLYEAAGRFELLKNYSVLINGTRKNDTGTYVCKENGTVLQSICVTILAKPNINLYLDDQRIANSTFDAYEGHFYNIKCTLSLMDNLNATISWSINKLSLSGNESDVSTINQEKRGLITSVLTYKPKTDFDIVTCAGIGYHPDWEVQSCVRVVRIPPELQIKYEDRTIVDHIEIPKEGNFTATCEVVNDVQKSVSIRMIATIGSDKREEHGHGTIALTVPVYTSVYLTCGNFLESHLQYNNVTVRVVVKTRVQVVIDDDTFTVDHDHDVISDKQIPVYCTGQGDISALSLQAIISKKGHSTNLPAKSHIKNIHPGFERSKWMLPQDVEDAVVTCLANSSVEKYNNTQTTVTLHSYVLPTVQITLDGKNLSTTFDLAPRDIYKFKCVAYQCRPSVNLTWEVNNATYHQEISNSSISRNIHRDDTVDVSISIDLHFDSKVKTVTCCSEGVKPFQRRRQSVTIVVTQRQLGSFLTYLLLCMGGVILLCCFASLFRKWRLHCSNQTHSLHYVSRYQNELPIELQDTQIDGNDSVPLHDPMPTGAKSDHCDRSRVTSLTLLSSHEGLMQYWLGNLEAENKTQIVARCVSDKARLKDAYEFMDLINQLDLSLCHENLVKLLGVSVSEIPCYIYHEYVPGGTLRDYLMNNFTSPDDSMLFDDQADGMTRKINELCWIAQNIASALDYLCKREYTHPAVSTRKILVDLRGTCKLYDILPLEKARTRVEYLISKEHPPLAWLAPESLFLGQYSALSDVWSFGIFLWELFAFGETPYAGNDAKQIEDNIRQRKLLNCPIVCPGGIYSLMISSWETDVSKRPSMSVLFMKLDEICNGYQQELPVSSGTEDSSHYHCLALDHEDDYVRCGNTT